MLSQDWVYLTAELSSGPLQSGVSVTFDCTMHIKKPKGLHQLLNFTCRLVILCIVCEPMLWYTHPHTHTHTAACTHTCISTYSIPFAFACEKVSEAVFVCPHDIMCVLQPHVLELGGTAATTGRGGRGMLCPHLCLDQITVHLPHWYLVQFAPESLLTECHLTHLLANTAIRTIISGMTVGIVWS